MNLIKDKKYLTLLGAIAVGIIIGLMLAKILFDEERLQNSKSNEESTLSSSFNDAVKKSENARRAASIGQEKRKRQLDTITKQMLSKLKP